MANFMISDFPSPTRGEGGLLVYNEFVKINITEMPPRLQSMAPHYFKLKKREFDIRKFQNEGTDVRLLVVPCGSVEHRSACVFRSEGAKLFPTRPSENEFSASGGAFSFLVTIFVNPPKKTEKLYPSRPRKGTVPMRRARNELYDYVRKHRVSHQRKKGTIDPKILGKLHANLVQHQRIMANAHGLKGESGHFKRDHLRELVPVPTRGNIGRGHGETHGERDNDAYSDMDVDYEDTAMELAEQAYYREVEEAERQELEYRGDKYYGGYDGDQPIDEPEEPLFMSREEYYQAYDGSDINPNDIVPWEMYIDDVERMTGIKFSDYARAYSSSGFHASTTNQFVIAPTLNGAHGEWTGSDDVEGYELFATWVCSWYYVTRRFAEIREERRPPPPPPAVFQLGPIHTRFCRKQYGVYRHLGRNWHRISCDLNGSHGEFTGSDDVNKPLVAVIIFGLICLIKSVYDDGVVTVAFQLATLFVGWASILLTYLFFRSLYRETLPFIQENPHVKRYAIIFFSVTILAWLSMPREQAEIIPYDHITFRPQLSGTHGEHTNGDDFVVVAMWFYAFYLCLRNRINRLSLPARVCCYTLGVLLSPCVYWFLCAMFGVVWLVVFTTLIPISTIITLCMEPSDKRNFLAYSVAVAVCWSALEHLFWERYVATIPRLIGESFRCVLDVCSHVVAGFCIGFRCNSLNGAHGEWTGSDDVKDREQLDALARARREAKNRLFKRKRTEAFEEPGAVAAPARGPIAPALNQEGLRRARNVLPPAYFVAGRIGEEGVEVGAEEFRREAREYRNVPPRQGPRVQRHPPRWNAEARPDNQMGVFGQDEPPLIPDDIDNNAPFIGYIYGYQFATSPWYHILYLILILWFTTINYLVALSTFAPRFQAIFIAQRDAYFRFLFAVMTQPSPTMFSPSITGMLTWFPIFPMPNDLCVAMFNENLSFFMMHNACARVTVDPKLVYLLFSKMGVPSVTPHLFSNALFHLRTEGDNSIEYREYHSVVAAWYFYNWCQRVSVYRRGLNRGTDDKLPSL